MLLRLIATLALVVAAAADWCNDEPYDYPGNCDCYEDVIVPAAEAPGVVDDYGWTLYGCTVLAESRWEGACASDSFMHSDGLNHYIDGGCQDEGEPTPVDFCGLCIEENFTAEDEVCTSMVNECATACGEQYGYDQLAEYLSGGKNSGCCQDNGCSSDYTETPGGGIASDDCIEGCIEDCYGSDDFLDGDRWNKEQCVCLVTDCYDSRDCDDNDVELIEEFVDTGCGADTSSYDYSYDYRNVEDIADGYGKDGAPALALSAVVAVAAAML